MRVVFLACRVSSAPVASGLPAGLSLRSVCEARDACDAVDIARLGELLAELPRGRPRGSDLGPAAGGLGLRQALVSHPRRQVESWLATTVPPLPVSDRPVGLISLVACPSSRGTRHSIGWLLVRPEARRHGIGRALVAHACRRAAERGAETVWVESRSDWPEAMAFWRAVGFQPHD